MGERKKERKGEKKRGRDATWRFLAKPRISLVRGVDGEFLWFRAILSFSRSQLASVPLSRALLMFQDKYQIQTTMRPPLYFVGN